MKKINNNIRESYCSFGVSKLLKEKGFAVQINGCYTHYLKTRKSDNPSFRMKKGEITVDSNFIINNDLGDLSNENYYQCARPTHSIAIEWIRVNFDIYCFPDPSYDFSCWIPRIAKKKEHGQLYKGIYEFDTEHQAVEAALIYTLKNLI